LERFIEQSVSHNVRGKRELPWFGTRFIESKMFERDRSTLWYMRYDQLPFFSSFNLAYLDFKTYNVDKVSFMDLALKRCNIVLHVLQCADCMMAKEKTYEIKLG